VNLEDYRVLFFVGTLGLALVAASPALSLALSFGGSERFSEFWLLDGLRRTEFYPFDVGVNESYSVFLGVGNHMGSSEYYRVLVKFRNSTMPLPDVDGSKPSSLPALYEFRFFVGDGGVWESRLTFGFEDVALEGDRVVVGKVVVDDVVFGVDAVSVWDSENSGFYFQLFFELWRLDLASYGFRFHNRYVGLWLNMTVS
jgi:hypothetical protein